MFYLKTNDCTRIEITDQNIFTTCPECGKEFHVDLMELVHGLDSFDLYGTQVFCDECSQKMHAKVRTRK